MREGVVDYEELVLAELDAAARSSTKEMKRNHLDNAAQFAALGERDRDGSRSFFMLEEAKPISEI